MLVLVEVEVLVDVLVDVVVSTGASVVVVAMLVAVDAVVAVVAAGGRGSVTRGRGAVTTGIRRGSTLLRPELVGRSNRELLSTHSLAQELPESGSVSATG